MGNDYTQDFIDNVKGSLNDSASSGGEANVYIDEKIAALEEETKNLAATVQQQSNEYTDEKITGLIGGASPVADTLKEIEDALKEDDNVAAALEEAIGTRAKQADLEEHVNKDDIHHTHDNKSVLDETTANYTVEEKEKLRNIADGANAYTHPTTSGNKHIPSGGSSGQILRWGSDGTAVWGNDNNYALTIQGDGTTLTNGTYDGSDAKTVNITPSSIGAAASNHTHSYAGSSSAGGAATTALACTGNAATATKAAQDASGNVITDTYASKSLYGDTTVNVGRLPETTVGTISFAFGMDVTASGNETHAEGFGTTASGDQSHAEGNMTSAIGDQSHAEGNMTRASGESSHAEGNMTSASGESSHAEGFGTRASGESSHAEGHMTRASGESSHAEGYYATALAYQHAQGHYNDTSLATAYGSSGTSTGTAFVIGNGTSSTASNAFRVTGEGATYAKGAYNTSGADYAEFAEWADGNTDNEDRRGYFVTFDEEKTNMIRKANEGDYILGIVSGNPCIIGNSDEGWLGKYVFDEFGAHVYEEVEEQIEYVDEETGETKTKTELVTTYKLNPDYDPERGYTHRKDRPEWDYVGWMGVLSVRDDNTCVPGGYCKVADGGIATSCERGIDAYRVLERVNDNIVKVAFK